MSRALTRYGIPALLLMGLATIVYVLTVAANGAQRDEGALAFKRGAMQKLIVLDDTPAQPTGEFRSISGDPVTLQDFRGQVILVNLWATWCPPCVDEMPTLADLQRVKGSEDFAVITVSVDLEGDAEYSANELARLSDGVLPFYHDPNYSIPYAVKARGFPTSILYDRDGREIARIEGDANWASGDAYRLIDWAVRLD